MINQTKSQKYATMCYMYGLTAVLVIFQQCERDSQFDECQIILDALNGMNYVHKTELPLPIRYDNVGNYFTDLFRLIVGRGGLDIVNYLQKDIDTIKNYVRGT